MFGVMRPSWNVLMVAPPKAGKRVSEIGTSLAASAFA
jgi:hypothetical protein